MILHLFLGPVLYTFSHFQNTMDGFLLYLFGVAIRDLNLQGYKGDSLNLKLPDAKRVLFESLKLYPYNW